MFGKASSKGIRGIALLSISITVLMLVMTLQSALLPGEAGSPTRQEEDDDELESYYEKRTDLGNQYVEQYFVGDYEYDGLGYCIKSADMNNDGAEDLIVSAPFANETAGRIFIYLGGGRERTLEGFDADFTIHGVHQQGYLGLDMATGDVDGDGLQDLLLGGWLDESLWYGQNLPMVAEIYLFLGSSGWRETMSVTQADVVFYSNGTDHTLGWNMDIGDIDNDGKDDISMVELYQGPDYYQGNILIWKGITAFQSTYDVALGEYDIMITHDRGDPLLTYIDGFGYFGLGSSDLKIEDMNGDGFEDLLIGSDALASNGLWSGEVEIVFGSSSLLDFIDLAVYPHIVIESFPDFDLSYVVTGDMDGDGIKDIIVSAPDCFLDNSGGLFIFFGEDPQPAYTKTLLQADFIIRGALPYPDLGVKMIGDIDGDERDDILIHTYKAEGYRGLYYVFFASYMDPFLIRNEKNYYLAMTQPSGVIVGAGPYENFANSYMENSLTCNHDGEGGVEMILGNPYGSRPDMPLGSGEVYLMYDTISDVLIDYYRLDELMYQNHTTIGAGRTYHFEAYMRDTWDVEDIEDLWIEFHFREEVEAMVQVGWDQFSMGITERIDPENFINIDSSTVKEVGRWGLHVYMNLSFNPNMVSEAPVKSTLHVTAGKEMLRTLTNEEFFTVECDVEFSGDLTVEGSANGELLRGDFVQPEETLVFGGLKAVYEDTEISPPNDYFSLIMEDSYGTRFFNSSSSEKEIYFKTKTRQIPGVETYRFRIIDLRSGADDVSGNPEFFVNVDTDFPDQVVQIEARADSDIDTQMGADDDPEVYLSWVVSEDHTSEVIGYMYSTVDGGGTGQGTFVQSNSLVYDGLVRGWNNIYIWAVDEAHNYGPSGVVSVLYDTNDPVFGLPDPTPGSWINTNTVNYGITIYDTEGSGVAGRTAEYSISFDGGKTYSAWEPTNIRRNSQELKVRLFLTLREGDDNLVRWRAKDVAGNGHVESEPYLVKVDTQELTYKDPSPAEPVDSNYVSLGINIEDGQGSGVDASTIEYSISYNGVSNYGPWEKLDLTGSFSADYIETPSIYFERDTFNYVKWRAKDVAGNGYTYSEDIPIIINPVQRNHDPDPIISSPEPYEMYVDSMMITFDGSRSFDSDGDELIYLWYSDKDGYLGTSMTLRTRLSQNNHKITLHVDDGESNQSTSVDIVVLPDINAVDTDKDGIPDYVDDDDDNDGLLDILEDKNRNGLYEDNETDPKNPDTDGDGVTDKLDAAPLDKDISEEELENRIEWWVLLILIVAIVLVFLIIAVVVVMKQRTDREGMKARSELRRTRRNLKRYEVLTGVPTNDLPAIEAVQWALPSVISEASEFVLEPVPSEDLLPPRPEEEKEEEKVQPPEEEKPDLQDLEVPAPSVEAPKPEEPPPGPEAPEGPREDAGQSVTCTLCGSEFVIAPGQTSGECPLCGEMVNL